MNIPMHGLLRYGGVAAAAIFMLWSMPDQRAEALSLINPGSAPAARISSDDLTIEVRGGGHGGGGHGGGGFHGGGHGGGFHGGFHGGGFRGGHVFHGGGFRHGGFAFRHRHFHRRFFYAGYGPSYYYPHRRCRIIWSYYGPHRICHFRHWRHRGYW